MQLFKVSICNPKYPSDRTVVVNKYAVMANSELEAIKIIASEFSHKGDGLIKCSLVDDPFIHWDLFTIKPAEASEIFADCKQVKDYLV